MNGLIKISHRSQKAELRNTLQDFTMIVKKSMSRYMSITNLNVFKKLQIAKKKKTEFRTTSN